MLLALVLTVAFVALVAPGGAGAATCAAQTRMIEASLYFVGEQVGGRTVIPSARRRCWLIGLGARFHFNGERRPAGWHCFRRAGTPIVCKKANRRFIFYTESE